VVAVALAALIAKLYCILTTFGTVDVIAISQFGQVIDGHGMDYLYRTNRLFNHPPLAGSFFWLLYRWSIAISNGSVRGVPRALPILLRLPCALADLASVLLLLKIREKTGKPPYWALALFAASFPAFMVSAYHGNTDSIMVCLLLAAVYCCVAGNSIACGLMLGLCCNVKVIPVLLTPVFFFFWVHRGPRRAMGFLLTFAAFCLAGWSSALIGSPVQFFQNVLGYPSWTGVWGVTYWYSFLADHLHLVAPGRYPFEKIPWFLTCLKLAIIAGAIIIGWMRRKEEGLGFAKSVALAWVCFMILAPGFCPYYLIWIAPFLLCYSSVWYVIVTATSSVYLFVYYNTMSHGMPWNFADPAVHPTWSVWGNLPWAALVLMALWSASRMKNRPA
jgi:hypothetical protein